MHLNDWFEPWKSAYIVYYLVAECKHADAAMYLYALRRFSMNQWLTTTTELLRLPTKSRQLYVYSTLIEVSKGSLISQKAYMVPGLPDKLANRRFDYKECAAFVEEIRKEYLF